MNIHISEGPGLYILTHQQFGSSSERITILHATLLIYLAVTKRSFAVRDAVFPTIGTKRLHLLYRTADLFV
jgi:hypothetical protein